MNGETIVICPKWPPEICGVGDYTARLLEHWPSGDLPNVLVAGPVTETTSRLNQVEGMERSKESLLKHLPNEKGKVLVQYSGYGFDSAGFPRWLLEGLVEWKRETQGTLVVMFHEMWTVLPIWSKHYLRERLHRRAIGRLTRAADAVFTSTPSQAAYLRQLDVSGSVCVLPVGANVLPNPGAVASREEGILLLFGMQSSRVRTLRLMIEELKALAIAGPIRRILTIGSGDSPTLYEEEHGLLEACKLHQGYNQAGELPASEISKLMFTASFGLSAQDYLSHTKSGTFMAYAAHGLNILSPFAGTRSEEPFNWLVSAPELAAGITNASDLVMRSQQLQAWYHRTSSWSETALAFYTALNRT